MVACTFVGNLACVIVLPAPDDHLGPGPDRRVVIPGTEAVCGRGLPCVRHGIVFASGVGAVSAPDDHLCPGPDRRVPRAGGRDIGERRRFPGVRHGIVAPARVGAVGRRWCVASPDDHPGTAPNRRVLGSARRDIRTGRCRGPGVRRRVVSASRILGLMGGPVHPAPDHHYRVRPHRRMGVAAKRGAGGCRGGPGVGRRCVAPSGIQVDVAGGQSAPDDHLCAGPDRRRVVASHGSTARLGGRPGIAGRIITSPGVGVVSAPDDHLGPGPDHGVPRAGARRSGCGRGTPGVGGGVVPPAGVGQVFIGVVSAPDDHFGAGPDGRVVLLAQRRKPEVHHGPTVIHTVGGGDLRQPAIRRRSFEIAEIARCGCRRLRPIPGRDISRCRRPGRPPLVKAGLGPAHRGHAQLAAIPAQQRRDQEAILLLAQQAYLPERQLLSADLTCRGEPQPQPQPGYAAVPCLGREHPLVGCGPGGGRLLRRFRQAPVRLTVDAA